MQTIHKFIILLLVVIGFACNTQPVAETVENTDKIISLNGTLTEIICAIGLQNQLVGVDVTSTFPNSLDSLPKLGHTRNLNTEAILALAPTLIFAVEGELKPETITQLEQTGAKVLLIKHEPTLQGSQNTIKALCAHFKKEELAQQLINDLQNDLQKVQKLYHAPKVIFIYARGAGTLMVSGKGTAMANIIELAGGVNPLLQFDDFKPLTPEFLLEANPDAFLLFDSGLESLQGIEGLLQIPGIAETNAGKNKKIIALDGQLISGFGPRLGIAAQLINQKLKEINVE